MDSLPIELIRRIAIFTSFRTIHSLSLVSTKFRTAVYDWQVFKAAIDNGNSYEQRRRLAVEMRWDRNPITSSMPAELCARYACADYKSINMEREIFWESKEFIADFIRWGGVLAARGHPLIYLIGYTNLQDGFARRERPRSATDMYTYTFCLTTYLLSAEPSAKRHYNRIRQTPISVLRTSEVDLANHWDCVISSLFGKLYKGAFEGNRLPRTREEIEASYVAPDANAPVEKMLSAFSLHELCVRSVGILGYSLRNVMSGTNFRPRLEQAGGWDNADPRYLAPPPTGFEIPFESFMDLPAPYSQDDAVKFIWCHLPKMMSVGFLEEGKWMGVYSYNDLSGFDPHMVDIQFRVVSDEEYSSHSIFDINDDNDGSDYVIDDDTDYNNDGNDNNNDDIEIQLATAAHAREAERMPWLNFEKAPHNHTQVDYEEFPTNGEYYNLISSTAKDGVGKFILHGQIYPETGKMLLKKTYLKRGLQWEWLCFMTPFGIVGWWGNACWGGLVWLWKEDWCNIDMQPLPTFDTQSNQVP